MDIVLADQPKRKYPHHYIRVKFVIGNNLMDGYVAKTHPNNMVTIINSDGGWCVDSEKVLVVSIDVPVRCPYVPANVRKVNENSS